MSRTSGFLISGFFAALLLAVSWSQPASAHGRVFVGIGFGPVFPFYNPWYYPPYAYYPPPVYYPPPAPVYYTQPAPVAVAPTTNCTRFSGDATDDDSGRPFYGIACMQADGKWHIVDN